MAAPKDMQPLEVSGLNKVYPNGFKAVKDVSFHIKPGEVYGLLGVNGAGKTSIISCIMTLESITSGGISIFQHDIQKQPTLAKSLVGFVPQELISYGFFTVDEILDFHTGFYGYSPRDVSEHKEFILKELDLWVHRKKRIKMLSGGMQRRMLVARALVHRPKLVLLDEPTAGVDIQLRQKVKSLVRQLSSEGVALLLTTHYLEEAEELCDRIGVIHQGVMRKEGSPQQLIQELTYQEVSFSLNSFRELRHPQMKELKQEGKVLCFPFLTMAACPCSFKS